MSISADASINIRVDKEIKSKAQDVFTTLGIDMATAVDIFLRQTIKKNGIPFELVAEKPEGNSRKFGRMKGKMWMAEDWDEPLEEFEEYM